MAVLSYQRLPREEQQRLRAEHEKRMDRVRKQQRKEERKRSEIPAYRDWFLLDGERAFMALAIGTPICTLKMGAVITAATGEWMWPLAVAIGLTFSLLVAAFMPE